jgi:hypothetical protein
MGKALSPPDNFVILNLVVQLVPSGGKRELHNSRDVIRPNYERKDAACSKLTVPRRTESTADAQLG